MNIIEAIQQMREGKKVCIDGECNGYCYFTINHEDNGEREVVYQYGKSPGEEKLKLVRKDWVFNVYDVEHDDWIIID